MEADRIFTYLAQPHNTIVMPVHERIRQVRMCMEPDHYTKKNQIIKQLGALC